jgi:hypothetical protein
MMSEQKAFRISWQREQEALRAADAERAYLYTHVERDTGNIFYVGDVGEQRRSEASRKTKAMWQSPNVRDKMMLRDWRNSCCQYKFYWGA